ncbi:hypothetical protein [Nocardia sp. CY41]|uniref:hypothetical protein n=1 Tax=Nocardia sp. CY41 TaxID=2608686 RepID=UPI00135899BD|nr:hypothetical protein [Nocardia sp. CY41]
MEDIDLALIVNDDGTPRGVLDVSQIQSAATVMMYEYAVAAGDDDATDRVGIEWAQILPPDELGYTTAAALSLLARNVLGPLLQVLDAVSPELGADLRAKLVESRDYAQATLGGGR